MNDYLYVIERLSFIHEMSENLIGYDERGGLHLRVRFQYEKETLNITLQYNVTHYGDEYFMIYDIIKSTMRKCISTGKYKVSRDGRCYSLEGNSYPFIAKITGPPDIHFKFI